MLHNRFIHHTEFLMKEQTEVKKSSNQGIGERDQLKQRTERLSLSSWLMSEPDFIPLTFFFFLKESETDTPAAVGTSLSIHRGY